MPGDLSFSWDPAVPADAYNLWRVGAKTAIDAARSPGGGTVAAACVLAPASGCVVPGGVLAGGSEAFFQARPSCGGSEGE